MNIKITHRWLLEYLDTDATPSEIQKYLSLCGPSIESVTKMGDDYIYDIEITSNRIDMASVMGIAREASAILPRFGKKANLIHKTFSLPALKKNNLKLRINDSGHLTNRILAIMLDGVHIADSPAFIKERLEMAGIRSLNNLVDITNYIMLEIGHPTHVFDYDRVETGKFIFRKAQVGEKLTTLDGKSFTLKGNEVVIDDGTGRIIDLPSIMGTSNSVVTSTTKRVIFFIDNLNPVLVRKASMIHGIRTVAATYNEKSPDRELAYTALVRGVELINKYASPHSMSNIIDVYPQPSKTKSLVVPSDFIANRMGINISEEAMSQILKNLGLGVLIKNHSLHITIPSWRINDIGIKEDIIEEVARIYGYHRLPSNIQSTILVKQPKDIDLLFELQSKIKHFLKTIGLHEVMNYSMISEKMIQNSELDKEDHLILKNTISEEIKYMRTHLLPSLYMNIKNNEGKREVLKFFEIAKTYKKRTGELPNESYKLGIVVNTSFKDLKGIVDTLIRELNISYTTVKKTVYPFLRNNLQGEIFINDDWLVKFGQLSKQHQSNYQIKKPVFVAIFDFSALIKYQKPLASYKSINPFAEIKLDQTFANTTYEVVRMATQQSKLLQNIELISVFKNKFTLRFYFSSSERNIREEEAKNELEKIKKIIVS